jgi:CRISPR-associated endonuclease/helicase Cas3
MSTMPDFPAFFKALWGNDPFPWQTMLAGRVAQGRWPQAIDLPTAAGKTACIDAAIYALACQAETPVAERTAPRRIWFIVDRRIVVDEAFDRARAVAGKLRTATSGTLKEVAERLRRVGGTRFPLAVARMRGGILRDYGWSRLPSQPAVITSTVDQLGSRLMFRGYGHSHLAAPIFAGLAANDSLVVLDEAHCSIPFLQTLRSIAVDPAYRGEAWAESPLKTPFAFTFLSATPPQDIREESFPGAEREAALNHDELRKRLEASKVAELIPAKPKGGKNTDPLVAKAADKALSFIRGGQRRVAVIVNRVRTAEEVAQELERRKREVEGGANVVLLTGRIRPFERDRLVNKWKPFLEASKPKEPESPILFVSTQCIEVGADFSFDALVTECASLDALRQRFGRLDRMGRAGTSNAAILIREQDAKDSGDDPVYEAALSKTWALLNDKASEHEGRKIDFGFKALDAALEEVEDLSSYLAPKPDAPVLLPAHLDLLCQTAATPHPDPDIQLYLHGKARGSPEVRVLWRSDLSEDRTEIWVETISLCPPAGGEMLSVPLHRFRNWLAKSEAANDDADVEGVPDRPDASPDSDRPFLVWRGRDRSEVSNDANKIRPNDVVVLPAAYGINGLGQPPHDTGAAREWGFGKDALDLWEHAHDNAGRPSALRIHREVLKPWLMCPGVSELITLAEDPAWERKTLRHAIDAVISGQPADDASEQLPQWLVRQLRKVRRRRPVHHPDGGVIALSRSTRPRRVSEPDLFADDDDLTSALTPADGKEVSLEEHSRSVKYVVKRLAALCLPDGFTDWLQRAAYYHDVGKLDGRFQIMLRHGNEVAAADADEPLAKSANVPVSSSHRRAIREASRLPEKFRHEMLSLQLAQRHAPLPEDESAAALILHLIASHHGHARPFAPICLDPEPPPVKGRLGEITLEISAEERSASIPAHHLGSGLSERFWQLTRRYGWWGLAYLEAILRLGDWYGSEFIKTGEEAEL